MEIERDVQYVYDLKANQDGELICDDDYCIKHGQLGGSQTGTAPCPLEMFDDDIVADDDN